MKHQHVKIIPLLLVLMTAVAGCSTVPEPSLAEMEAKHLGFLKINETTREDVLTRLGTPSSVFENERILTYRLQLHPKYGFINGIKWHHYGLIVVFDENGRLEKLSTAE